MLNLIHGVLTCMGMLASFQMKNCNVFGQKSLKDMKFKVQALMQPIQKTVCTLSSLTKNSAITLKSRKTIFFMKLSN